MSTHGVLDDCSAGVCTYVPTAGYVGSDSFTFAANDGATNSNVATVSIAIVADPSAIVSGGPLTRIATTPDLNCAVNHTSDLNRRVLRRHGLRDAGGGRRRPLRSGVDPGRSGR